MKFGESKKVLLELKNDESGLVSKIVLNSVDFVDFKHLDTINHRSS